VPWHIDLRLRTSLLLVPSKLLDETHDLGSESIPGPIDRHVGDSFLDPALDASRNTIDFLARLLDHSIDLALRLSDNLPALGESIFYSGKRRRVR
jgi:hypothetical protein